MAQIPATDILDYWFRELGPGKWFNSPPEVDAEICARFRDIHEGARLMAARNTDEFGLGNKDDYLAAILLFDQFPRNMFRGLPQSFATDALARQLSHRAIEQGFDMEFPAEHRVFFYLPF